MIILPHWRGGSFVGVISPYHSDSVVSQDHVIRVTSVPLASEHRRKVSVVLFREKYTFKTVQCQNSVSKCFGYAMKTGINGDSKDTTQHELSNFLVECLFTVDKDGPG